jgi:hypothetical protein
MNLTGAGTVGSRQDLVAATVPAPSVNQTEAGRRAFLNVREDDLRRLV